MAKKYSGGGGGGGSSVTVSNEGNNRVITSDGSGGLVGESDLTFDGLVFTVSGGGGSSVAITNGQLTMSGDLNVADGGDIIMGGNAGRFTAPRLKLSSHTSSTSLVANTHAGLYNLVTGSGIVITLPDNQTGGTHFTIISADANGFTLRTGSGAGDGDNMNGSQSDITVASFSAVTAVSTGTDYVVLGV